MFVDVEGSGETVEVGKRDGQLYVRVETRSERVYVTVPFSAVEKVVRKLERANPDLESVEKWKIDISTMTGSEI